MRVKRLLVSPSFTRASGKHQQLKIEKNIQRRFLSANGIRDHIKRLPSTFGIDPREFAVYLREDRDAGEEM